MRKNAKVVTWLATLALLGVACGGGGGGGGGGGSSSGGTSSGGTSSGGTSSGGTSSGGTSSGGSSSGGTAEWKSVGPSDMASLYGIWGTAANNIWAVGYNNSIVHYDGANWTSQLSGTSGQLHAVWGSDSTHVWAAGGSYGWSTGSMFVLNGTTWTKVFDGQDSLGDEFINAIWGTSSTNVWAVGGYSSTGTILHLTGSTWSKDTSFDPSSPPALYAIWGTAADNVYAVGETYKGGAIVRWNGTKWAKVLEGSDTFALFDLRAVWGTGANDVWAAGSSNIARWNGTEWKVEQCLHTLEDIAQVTAGTTLTACPPSILGLWGTTSSDVWAIGSIGDGGYGYAAHWDGAHWTVAWNDISGLNALWANGAGDIWAAGEKVLSGGVLLHYQR